MTEFILDCLGEACPIPLIKVKKKMEDLAVGDVLIVEVDHSCAMKNVPEWARNQGYHIELDDIGGGEWELIIEKTK